MITAPARSAWVLLICGLLGWLASVVLTVERFELYTDPGYQPSCNVNAVLSCGSVMSSPQAAEFGFPNPLIGIVGFSVVMTVAVLAVANVGLPRWFWGGLWAGLVLGVGFIGWLISQSLYRIHALCPYCMVVWTVTPLLVALVTGLLWARPVGLPGLLVEWRWTMLAVYYAVVVVLVFLQFPWSELV
ncbi:vitamin K epoxide reductase family protein [Nocardia stercoris]|uniref:Vitamin K epoxide reductase family protein n=1 Tax=Nocardia stercoris TaxID=2483361 RepID=A0A3M2KW74_9NOCA|nr:vitamin K epoxide reductase family protein [Nocardia stercoris]RMI28483.1 vitamin K epoxide reductase family protein [Nocardia stercoris]